MVPRWDSRWCGCGRAEAAPPAALGGDLGRRDLALVALARSLLHFFFRGRVLRFLEIN
jgi:hypothetical protein